MKPVYTNDRKAPRMKKGKFSVKIITIELWKDFLKEFPEHKEISWPEFYKLWGDVAETIREETIKNPLGVKLGCYVGELKLQYLPYRFESSDYKGSEELGRKVSHSNIVSRGKQPKIKWERRWAVKFNKTLQFFAFEPTRELNRLARTYIPLNSEKLRMSRNTLGGSSVWKKYWTNKPTNNGKRSDT